MLGAITGVLAAVRNNRTLVGPSFTLPVTVSAIPRSIYGVTSFTLPISVSAVPHSLTSQTVHTAPFSVSQGARGLVGQTANTLPLSLSSGGDPLIGNVKLLAHFDGSTIVDSSYLANTMTAFNGATLSTTQSKFGGSSLYTPGGNNCRVDVTPSAGMKILSSQPFTIEFWLYMQNTSAGLYPVASHYAGAGNSLVWFTTLTSGNLQCYFCGSTIGGASAATPISANTWHFVSVTWDGTTRRFFMDGNLVLSDTTAFASQVLDTGWSIGGPDTSTASQGGTNYIDDFRVTYGSARYVSNFTPPTTAFLNF